MPKTPTIEDLVADLPIMEQLLLSCLVSGTDWAEAGVTHATAQVMVARGLIEHERARYRLTDRGRAVLDALSRKPIGVTVV